ncbi:MAG: sigma-70 family RNA polymerase sigma factor [Bacteroidetes bacterium]|nr:sigma-70 family RNA polymerase sigma factor [Bacteroidota bacterium]
MLTLSTDDQILALVQSADTKERGFRLLVSTYQQPLYTLIRRMVRTHEDADDVLQECLIKAYRGIGRFEGKSKLYTWLYRIATNEALTFLKKRQRRAEDALEDEGQAGVYYLRAEPPLDGNDLQRKLERAMTQLPDKQRLVFNLRYFEEMSYKEMGVLLQTSVGALKASYHHAVKKVEAILKAEM